VLSRSLRFVLFGDNLARGIFVSERIPLLVRELGNEQPARFMQTAFQMAATKDIARFPFPAAKFGQHCNASCDLGIVYKVDWRHGQHSSLRTNL
jgi:hypothetical protein